MNPCSRTSPFAPEHVDKIVYINLDLRPDRRAQVERALRSLRLMYDNTLWDQEVAGHARNALARQNTKDAGAVRWVVHPAPQG